MKTVGRKEAFALSLPSLDADPFLYAQRPRSIIEKVAKQLEAGSGQTPQSPKSFEFDKSKPVSRDICHMYGA